MVCQFETGRLIGAAIRTRRTEACREPGKLRHLLSPRSETNPQIILTPPTGTASALAEFDGFCYGRASFLGEPCAEAGCVKTTVVLCTDGHSAGGRLGVRPDAGNDLLATVRSQHTEAGEPKKAADPSSGLYVPEIWRLPAVGDPSPFAQPPAEIIPTPPVLVVPPAETISVPDLPLKPPVVNGPTSLSGILSDGEHIEIKPDPDKLWDGSFNLGLDGSEGNTEAFNFRFNVNATRKTELSVLTANLDYKKQTSQD